MITQRLLCLALFALAASSALTNHVAAQSDACARGFVWREAFDGDHVCVSPDTRERAKSDNANAAELRANKGSDECVQGFVWRLANPEDHVCVPQITREQTAQDNELAYSRLASGPPAPLPPMDAAPPLPLPPAKAGCHILKKGEWQEIPCTPEEESKKFPPPAPALSIQDQQRMIGSWPIAVPLKRGSINIEVKSDRTLGTVTDVLPPHSHILCPELPDSAEPVPTPNGFSIQLNTNRFTTQYGSTGWVQFTYQTGRELNHLCVWKFDIDVWQKDRTKGKENLCVPTEPGIFLGPNATGNPAARQGASLTGMIMKLPDRPETFLIAWGGFAWAPGGSPLSDYAVVTTDEIKDTNRGLPDNGLKYPLGLRGQWTQATGDIYGKSCGSNAVFTGVQIFETLTVSTCYWDLNCIQGPWGPFSLQNFATPVPDPNSTAERNNLLPTVITSLPGNPTSVFYCPFFEECRRWGTFHSPK